MGKFLKHIWLWLVLFGIALFMLSNGHNSPSDWNSAEKTVVDIISPFQKWFSNFYNKIESFWLSYFYLVDVHKENLALKEEVAHLKKQNDQYYELEAANTRLRELVNFSHSIDYKVIAAQVMGREPTRRFDSVIIDKGYKDNISKDMPVVTSSGVVGRIVAVSRNYSQVLLLIDKNSSIDALLQRTRDRGIIKGSGRNNPCSFNYLETTADVMIGDRIITSGLEGLFPKGISIAYVTDINPNIQGSLFKEIYVQPAVDFSKLEEVLVILREKLE